MQLLVLKLLYILFTTQGTSEYFYTNDLCVLVDVFLREVVDLDEDSESVRPHLQDETRVNKLTGLSLAPPYLSPCPSPPPHEDPAPFNPVQALTDKACARIPCQQC
jgi:hypothetical protein